MKIAITGKGGVGKTTIAAALAFCFSDKGFRVIAVDADPDANLASALAIPQEEAGKIKPIAKLKELAEERTGVKPGTLGGFFSLNPEVSDIPENYSYKLGNINFLALGTIEKGGAGCICPEGALLKALMRHLFLAEKDIVIMDMEAGVEHLGRGISNSMDALLIVIEPGLRSIETAKRIKKLAADLYIKDLFIVLNKVKNKEQESLVLEQIGDVAPVICTIYESDQIQASDLSGVPAYKSNAEFAAKISGLAEKLERKVASIVE